MNNLLEELKGCTWNRKVNDNAYKYLLEEKRRTLGYQPTLSATSLITVRQNNEILSIGGSIPSDLILDNFGKWLTAFIHAPTTTTIDVTVNEAENAGAAVSIRIYNALLTELHFNNNTNATGTRIRIGQGSTTPLRTDKTLSSPLAIAPLDTYIDTGSGSYGGGAITVSAGATAGGSGSALESGFYGRWYSTTAPAGLRNIMLFHDLISPSVTWVGGQAVTCEYRIQL